MTTLPAARAKQLGIPFPQKPIPRLGITGANAEVRAGLIRARVDGMDLTEYVFPCYFIGTPDAPFDPNQPPRLPRSLLGLNEASHHSRSSEACGRAILRRNGPKEKKTMQLMQLPNNEAAILTRLVGPDPATLSPEAARAILTIGFGQADKDRMQALAAKARAGTLTVEEQDEVEAYSRIGSLISILKSKARRSLKNKRGPNGKAH
jgi:plasmid stability protein